MTPTVASRWSGSDIATVQVPLRLRVTTGRRHRTQLAVNGVGQRDLPGHPLLTAPLDAADQVEQSPQRQNGINAIMIVVAVSRFIVSSSGDRCRHPFLQRVRHRERAA